MKAQAVVAPGGYERFSVGTTVVVARNDAAPSLRDALADATTLHGWAATLSGAVPFQGRTTAWGITLPGVGLNVVVRHAQRGGLLAAVRGDRFLWPGRAPWELAASLRLQSAGIRTPDVVAYALYGAGRGFCRCDVVTRRLPDGADFPVAWQAGTDAARREVLAAVGALLRDLRAAGAQHADLNAKNLYIAREDGRAHAWVLDVDRLQFRAPGDAAVGAQNLARLDRSLRKWRERGDLFVTESQLAELAAIAESRL